jgi:hypothetical protein
MNCKPGDLAIITQDAPLCAAPLAGTLVEVLEPGDMLRNLGQCWICKFLSAPKEIFGFFHDSAHVPDCFLRPLPGDVEPEIVEQPEEVTA